MSYPDYPKNRLIVDGVDLTIRYHMILLDGYTLSPPEPKTYTVDIPGGDGVIDLTNSLTGDVSFKNRQQEFTFMVVNPDSFERVKTEVSNFLHGKSFDYQMTMDPGYTYHGRFTIDEYSHKLYSYPGLVGTFSIKIDADPYKLKQHMTYNLNAIGGKMFRLESGRKPVHPVVKCSQPSKIRWKDTIINVPVGTHRLNDVLFTQGYNEIYINSYELLYTKWDDIGPYKIIWDKLGEDAEHPTTWDGASSYRWYTIGEIGKDDSEDDDSENIDVVIPRYWNDVSAYRWDDLQRFSAEDYQNEDGGYDDLIIPRCWDDVSNYRWADFKPTDPDYPFDGKTWEDLDYFNTFYYQIDREYAPGEAPSYDPDGPDGPEGGLDPETTKTIPDFAKVHISYDWKDL